MRGLTRGKTLIRVAAVVAFMITAFLVIFTGASGSSSRAAALFGVRAVFVVLVGLQGGMLWGYANRLTSLHRAPSFESVAEVMRWLRYAWIVFLVINVFALFGIAALNAYKALPAMALFVTARRADVVKEAVALRWTALVSVVVFISVLLFQVVDFYGETRQTPTSLPEVLAGGGFIVLLYAVVLYLVLSFAGALRAYARTPSNDTLLAVARAYGLMFGSAVSVILIGTIAVIYAAVSGQTDGLQPR